MAWASLAWHGINMTREPVEANAITASSKHYGLCKTPRAALGAAMAKHRMLLELTPPFYRWPWLGAKKPLLWSIGSQCELSFQGLAHASDPFLGGDGWAG